MREPGFKHTGRAMQGMRFLFLSHEGEKRRSHISAGESRKFHDIPADGH